MSQDAVVVDGFGQLLGWDGPVAKNYFTIAPRSSARHIIECSMLTIPFFSSSIHQQIDYKPGMAKTDFANKYRDLV